MTWIDMSQYNPNDICSICQDEYGTTQGIYKTPCNHIFHNNCLNDYCENNNGDIQCPLCKTKLDFSNCMDVYAFKE